MAISIIIRGADDAKISRGDHVSGSDPGDVNPYRNRPADENGMKVIEEGDPLEDEMESPATAMSEDELGETDHVYDDAGEPHDAAGGETGAKESPFDTRKEKKDEKKKGPKSFFSLMGYGKK